MKSLAPIRWVLVCDRTTHDELSTQSVMAMRRLSQRKVTVRTIRRVEIALNVRCELNILRNLASPVSFRAVIVRSIAVGRFSPNHSETESVVASQEHGPHQPRRQRLLNTRSPTVTVSVTKDADKSRTELLLAAHEHR